MTAGFLSAELGDFLCDDLGLLLLGNHDFEAIEIRQRGASFLGGHLLCPRGSVPGTENILTLQIDEKERRKE
jgi:hypothetical protein